MGGGGDFGKGGNRDASPPPKRNEFVPQTWSFFIISKGNESSEPAIDFEGDMLVFGGVVAIHHIMFLGVFLEFNKVS